MYFTEPKKNPERACAKYEDHTVEKQKQAWPWTSLISFQTIVQAIAFSLNLTTIVLRSCNHAAAYLHPGHDRKMLQPRIPGAVAIESLWGTENHLQCLAEQDRTISPARRYQYTLISKTGRAYVTRHFFVGQ